MDLPVRKSEEIVNSVFESMSRALVNGERIEVRGFGSFAVKKYRDYTGRDPKTGGYNLKSPPMCYGIWLPP